MKRLVVSRAFEGVSVCQVGTTFASTLITWLAVFNNVWLGGIAMYDFVTDDSVAANRIANVFRSSVGNHAYLIEGIFQFWVKC